MNFANIMMQAKQIQKKLEAAQKELSESNFTAEAGNGAVSVVCSGQGKFKSIKLSAEGLGLDAETAETIEDLITVAMKNATEQADKTAQNKIKGIVPPGINIPGLF